MKKSRVSALLHAVSLLVLASAGLLLASCASAPLQYPPAYAPQPKTLPVSFDAAFGAAKEALNGDSRLIVDTVDKAGRLIVYEKTSGIIFLQHRTILDIKLESGGPEQTMITMRASAQDYDIGGFTREAGWYPSLKVDTFFADDVMSLIEKEALKTRKP